MKKRGKLLGILWILVWAWGLLTIFLLIAWNNWLGNRIEEGNLWKQCQEEIKLMLKSPASAQFSNFMKIWDNIVVYDVDAQNSFWALIRTTYLCNLGPSMFNEQRVFEVEWIEDIESIDVIDVELCIKNWILGYNFSDCLFEAQRAQLREKTCNEAKELYQQGLLSGEHVNNVCASLWLDGL